MLAADALGLVSKVGQLSAEGRLDDHDAAERIERKLQSFMRDVLLPIAARTNALFIVDGLDGACMLGTALQQCAGDVLTRTGEARAPSFPRSLHNAAELFVHLGHTDSAAQLHRCVTRTLQTLEVGPDGRSAQRLGRACVCWGCGHVGLPKNADQCSERSARPAGVCAGCGEDGQTNFVRVLQEGGKTVPWIECAEMSEAQAAKMEEAARAAEAAEQT